MSITPDRPVSDSYRLVRLVFHPVASGHLPGKTDVNVRHPSGGQNSFIDVTPGLTVNNATLSALAVDNNPA